MGLVRKFVSHMYRLSYTKSKKRKKEKLHMLMDSYYEDDPELWANQPVTIQIVARPFDDEALIGATGRVDDAVNGSD